MSRLVAKLSGVQEQSSNKISISKKLVNFIEQEAIELSSSNSSVKPFYRLAQELPLRILLADDSSLDRIIALRVLHSLGYRADVVINGLELLKALDQQHYDLVITDIQMPYMGGLEATRLICQQWSPETRPYIIALTSENEPNKGAKYLDAGMSSHINKPLGVDKLIQALMNC